MRRVRMPRIHTVIGQEVEIHGKVVFQGGMHLDGTVYGDVVSIEDDPTAALVVSDSGAILGDVRVSNIYLNGTVEGDVEVEGRAELGPGAHVKGTLYYRLLEMAIGAEVNGKLVCRDVKEGGEDAGAGAREPADAEVPEA